MYSKIFFIRSSHADAKTRYFVFFSGLLNWMQSFIVDKLKWTETQPVFVFILIRRKQNIAVVYSQFFTAAGIWNVILTYTCL